MDEREREQFEKLANELGRFTKRAEDGVWYDDPDTDLMWIFFKAGAALAPAQPIQEPVAWIRKDHLQQAQQAPFMCRVEPSYREGFDLVPICLAAPSPTKEQTPASSVASKEEE